MLGFVYIISYRGGVMRLFIAVLILLLSIPAKADFASTMSMGLIVKYFKDSSNEIIDHAAAKADSTAASVAQKALIVVNELERAYQDSMQMTFDELDESQQIALNGISELIDQAVAGVELSTRSFERLSTKAHALVISLPGTDRSPKFYDVSPRYIPQHAVIGDNVVLNVDAFNFYKGEKSGKKPWLELNDRKIQAVEVSQGQAIFHIKKSLFQYDGQHVSPQKMTLHAYGGTKLIGNEDEYTYDIVIYLPPIKVATVEIYSVYESVRHTQRKKSGEFHQKSSYHHTKSSCDHQAKPSDGWKIDPDKPNVTFITTQNKNGKFQSFGSIHEQLITVCLKADPRGTKYGNKWEHEGEIRGYVEFDEYRIEQAPAPSKLKEGTVSLLNSVSQQIPKEASGFIVKVKGLDDSDLEYFMATEANRFVKIEYDAGTGIVIVRPKPAQNIYEL